MNKTIIYSFQKMNTAIFNGKGNRKSAECIFIFHVMRMRMSYPSVTVSMSEFVSVCVCGRY